MSLQGQFQKHMLTSGNIFKKGPNILRRVPKKDHSHNTDLQNDVDESEITSTTKQFAECPQRASTSTPVEDKVIKLDDDEEPFYGFPSSTPAVLLDDSIKVEEVYVNEEIPTRNVTEDIDEVKSETMDDVIPVEPENPLNISTGDHCSRRASTQIDDTATKLDHDDDENSDNPASEGDHCPRRASTPIDDTATKVDDDDDENSDNTPSEEWLDDDSDATDMETEKESPAANPKSSGDTTEIQRLQVNSSVANEMPVPLQRVRGKDLPPHVLQSLNSMLASPQKRKVPPSLWRTLKKLLSSNKKQTAPVEVVSLRKRKFPITPVDTPITLDDDDDDENFENSGLVEWLDDETDEEPQQPIGISAESLEPVTPVKVYKNTSSGNINKKQLLLNSLVGEKQPVVCLTRIQSKESPNPVSPVKVNTTSLGNMKGKKQLLLNSLVGEKQPIVCLPRIQSKDLPPSLRKSVNSVLPSNTKEGAPTKVTSPREQKFPITCRRFADCSQRAATPEDDTPITLDDDDDDDGIPNNSAFAEPLDDADKVNHVEPNNPISISAESPNVVKRNNPTSSGNLRGTQLLQVNSVVADKHRVSLQRVQAKDLPPSLRKSINSLRESKTSQVPPVEVPPQKPVPAPECEYLPPSLRKSLNSLRESSRVELVDLTSRKSTSQVTPMEVVSQEQVPSPDCEYLPPSLQKSLNSLQASRTRQTVPTDVVLTQHLPPPLQKAPNSYRSSNTMQPCIEVVLPQKQAAPAEVKYLPPLRHASDRMQVAPVEVVVQTRTQQPPSPPLPECNYLPPLVLPSDRMQVAPVEVVVQTRTQQQPPPPPPECNCKNTIDDLQAQLTKARKRIQTLLQGYQKKQLKIKRLGAKLSVAQQTARLTVRASHEADVTTVFTALQMKNLHKAIKGRRFTPTEKAMGLALYKKSPECYNLLREMFCLPSRKSLCKVSQIIKLGEAGLLTKDMLEDDERGPNEGLEFVVEESGDECYGRAVEQNEMSDMETKEDNSFEQIQ